MNARCYRLRCGTFRSWKAIALERKHMHIPECYLKAAILERGNVTWFCRRQISIAALCLLFQSFTDLHWKFVFFSIFLVSDAVWHYFCRFLFRRFQSGSVAIILFFDKKWVHICIREIQFKTDWVQNRFTKYKAEYAPSGYAILSVLASRIFETENPLSNRKQ